MLGARRLCRLTIVLARNARGKRRTGAYSLYARIRAFQATTQMALPGERRSVWFFGNVHVARNALTRREFGPDFRRLHFLIGPEQ